MPPALQSARWVCALVTAVCLCCAVVPAWAQEDREAQVQRAQTLNQQAVELYKAGDCHGALVRRGAE